MTTPASPTLLSQGTRSVPMLLAAMAAVNAFAFATWWALINNYGKEVVGIGGAQIGAMQSIREIPGFLAFTAILWIAFIREQTFAWMALIVLGLGVAAAGLIPTVWAFYLTTFIMSVGFHYYETMGQSLSLQLLAKDEAPRVMGRVVAVAAFAQLAAYGIVTVSWKTFNPGYTAVFLFAGAVAILGAIAIALWFPRFEGKVVQRKGFVLRRKYWLYYAITFMAGARRQIFMAFGAFLLVDRFKFAVTDIALLFLLTCVLNMVTAPRLGDFVAKFGERRTIAFENITLIVVFLGYALSTAGWLTASFYVVDAVFVTLTIAHRTYFQKIADPADIAPTSAVAFTINHIAAVVIPVTFGLIWLWNPSAVFVIGTGIACVSLGLSFLVPHGPEQGRETIFAAPAKTAPAE